MDVMTYESGGGTGHFISFEDLRRICWWASAGSGSQRPGPTELDDAAIVRELHVYGSQVGVGSAAQSATDQSSDDAVGQHQHRGYGRRLLAKAEELAADTGYSKLAVISGIGVREVTTGTNRLSPGRAVREQAALRQRRTANRRRRADVFTLTR